MPTDSGKWRPLRRRFGRRDFLKTAGATASIAALGTVAACDDSPSKQDTGLARLDALREAPISYADNVPVPPADIRPDVLNFFSPDEAKTVSAFIGRLLPGTPDDPGAVDAGVLTFIDVKLAAYEGFWEPTYREPPFAEIVDQPPEAIAQDSGSSTVRVAKSEAGRYGFQSMLSPREAYRGGIANLDRYAQAAAGAKFADLSPAAQDGIVGKLKDGDIDGFDKPDAKAFFKMVRQDVIEGMFGDPAYGGNREKAGWKLINYPGAQRGYTVDDMHNERSNREPQSLAELHGYIEGSHGADDAILPVSSAHQH